jgi:hypothetical protein
MNTMNTISRIFREARYTRGNTSITKIQPIDDAAWVWHPALVTEIPGLKARVVRFRAEFDAADEPLVFDVSADERLVLVLDGEIVLRGPNRGLVENWQYHTYEAKLAPGRHIIEATCWTIGEFAPLAQLSWKGGFIFKAAGAYDVALTTGKESSIWKVGIVPGTTPAPPTPGSNAWGTGGTFVIEGDGILHAAAEDWQTPVIVRTPVTQEFGSLNCGGRLRGWMLFPAQLPDQLERAIAPGAFRAVSEARPTEFDKSDTLVGEGPQRKRMAVAISKPYFYTEADGDNPLVASFNALVREGRELLIPANSFIRALWDLDDYYGVYPDVVTDGGAGAEIKFGFHESLVGQDGLKRDRNAFVGKHLWGYGDVYHPDGREGHFTSLWWRTGRWAEIEITTADAPLTIKRLGLVESRYPLERESAFTCDDDTLPAVQKICLRGMQMCCHEMLFDCPFYEQQMYPGDTRVQLLVITALTRDDRMIRRAIEIYDLAARDDGQVPFNYPTRGLQEGGSYTLCWLLMFGDYVMWHDNVAWLRARVPALRHTLAGIALYEDADGILRNLPGWNFLDWVNENPFKTGSWAPGSVDGEAERGSILTLFWILALQSAAKVERALGDEAMAAYCEAKAARIAESVIRIFWDESRGMIADTDAKDHFSEHALSLAIIANILPADKRERVARALLEEKDLARATVYFSYYLFQAYFAIGRGDLFQKRLDLWRNYVRIGLRTPLESPGERARSDCHAWGAHPIFWLQSGTAGVSPAASFFRKVRVAPQPGALKFVKAKVPHPQGFVEVDLRFADGAAKGTVTLPAGIDGEFVFGGRKLPLVSGENRI